MVCVRNVFSCVAMAAFLAAAGSSSLAAPASSAASAAAARSSQRPVDGLIVKLKDASSHERIQSLGANAQASEDGRVERVKQMARMTEARHRPSGRAAQLFGFGRELRHAEALEMAERLRAQPEVEWVELNTRERLLQAVVTPNDVFFPYVASNDTGQWWLRRPAETFGTPAVPSYGVPDVQAAWSSQRGGPSVVVAVLDTGTTSHPDLNARYLPGYDFVSSTEYSNDGNGRDNNASDPGDWVTQVEVNNNPSYAACDVQPSSWHGTVISGIVAAQTDNNNIGVAGINWNGRILPVRVATKCGATVEDITDGMRWAAGLSVAGVPNNPNPARVVNISFGGSDPCGRTYQDTINELAAIGVVVVAAAGNDGGRPTRPASCSGVIGVAALARDGLKASYSNFGSGIVISTVGGEPNVDDGILTTNNLGAQGPGTPSYGSVFGTSFSAPIVSGTIALMLSTNPYLTVPQIVAGLQTTARPHVLGTNVPVCSATDNFVCQCTTATCGAGILDTAQAVRYAANPPVANGSGGGGGGGALGWMWLTGLALGVAATALTSRARARTSSRAN